MEFNIAKIISKIISGVAVHVCKSHNTALLEMATFGIEKWGKETYKIAVHGAASKDRPTPHLHIYLNKDQNPYTQFNFEVSLVDILCKDELNLIFQIDKAHNVNNRNRTECTWTGYRDIKEGLHNFLIHPCKKKTEYYSNNLQRAIYEWNKETDFVKTEFEGKNVLRDYFIQKQLVPLPKYVAYLDDYPAFED